MAFGLVIPVAVGTLAVANYIRRPKDYGTMTAERTSLFNAAISGALKDPDKLDTLATAFEGQGLFEQAKLLRQRAKLRRLPEDTQKARRDVFRKAMLSKNKQAILTLAAAYDAEGCTGAAMRLREKASGLPVKVPETAPSSPVAESKPPESEPNPEESVSAPSEVQT